MADLLPVQFDFIMNKICIFDSSLFFNVLMKHSFMAICDHLYYAENPQYDDFYRSTFYEP